MKVDIKPNFIKITYDVGTDSLQAEGKGRTSKSNIEMDYKANGLAGINILLAELAKKNKMSLAELYDAKLITFDDEAFARYRLDDVNGQLVERRRKFNLDRTGNTSEEVVDVVSKDETDISQETDFDIIANAIIKLNPHANIKLENAGVFPRRIYSDVPGDKLVLPKGFYYNDENGITNKHLTESGMYTSIQVEALEKYNEIVVEKDVKEETTETKTVVVNKETDGAVDVTDESTDVKVEKTVESSEKEIKIKNLRITNWKLLKPLLVAGATIATIAVIASAVKNKGDGKVYYFESDNDTNDYNANQMDDGSVQTTYNTPEEEEFVHVVPVEDYEFGILNYGDYGYLYGEDMGNQLDDINAICYENIYDLFQFINGGSLVEAPMLCHLQELVPEEDQEAVRIIVSARNNVVNNAYSMQDRSLTMNDVDNLLAQFINYIYEGGTMFNGHSIKSFDSLNPYSKYVVAVLGQSTLQLRPDYQHTTNYEAYNFGDLVGRYDDIVNYNYSVLTNGYVR